MVAVAVAENETVTVHVGLQGLLVNVAVTPVGSADVVKVTNEAAPLASVAVIEEEGLVAPCTTVRLPGVAGPRLKSNAALTVRDSVAV
jgi:hypothetical protein